jgi:hypothetical protein
LNHHSHQGPNRASRHFRVDKLIALISKVMLALLLLVPAQAPAYSVQTHEQLIDLTWKNSIRPLLLRHFPGTTPEQLREAHAYAYGGCAIQDLGYYPFGHEFFSDLTHYVRSADFVRSLLRNAKDANELAFAIGALSHYVGDSVGHAEAVNPAVAMEFPKLRQRYGPSVTYDESPHAHVRAEFAFDINEISKHRFAPSAYLRHVGLEVPEDLVARAFFETYGLDLRSVLGGNRPIIRGYRFAVRSFLPRIAYAEALLHKDGFPPDTPSQVFDEFKQHLAQADFENGWNAYRKKPGIGTHLLAALIVILPKIGKLSQLAIRGPNVQTEQQYVVSVNHTTARLRQLLGPLDGNVAALPNRDLDTGEKVRPGGYRLTDRTYAKLLDEITREPARMVPAGLKRDVIAYYDDPDAPISTKNDHNKWKRVQTELTVLACMRTTSEPPPLLKAEASSR